jgi:hypothetical protein
MTVVRLLIILLFAQTSLLAQPLLIKGIVVDGETGAPLPNASVFINNSTKGTITNAAGEFVLGPYEPGVYEIVASFVGYENLLYVADLKKGSVRIRFELDRKAKQIRDLLILTNETRDRYLKIFKSNLLGFTSAADRCKIKNIRDVQFAAGSNANEVIAYCDTTLLIDNPELGYTIQFDLIDFYFNRQTGESRFYGYTRFIDKSGEGETKRRWAKRRREAYEGSTQHFFRSLAQRTLKNEGFTVQQVYRKEMKREAGVPNVITLNGNGSNSMDFALTVTEDSLLRLHSDSGYKIYEIRTADRLRISFHKNTALKTAITQTRIVGGQPREGTIMGIVPHLPPVLLDYKGRLQNPLSIYYDGIWSFERLASMLPEDYEPD